MPNSIEAKPIPPLIPRTLRCANTALYASSAVMILAACGWYISTHDSLTSCALAGAAGTAGLLWAAYYCTLRFTLNQTGVHCSSLFSQRSISWDSLTAWDIEATEDREQATCRILFYSADSPTPLSISSELIDLDTVRRLARELQGLEPYKEHTPDEPATDEPPPKKLSSDEENQPSTRGWRPSRKH